MLGLETRWSVSTKPATLPRQQGSPKLTESFHQRVCFPFNKSESRPKAQCSYMCCQSYAEVSARIHRRPHRLASICRCYAICRIFHEQVISPRSQFCDQIQSGSRTSGDVEWHCEPTWASCSPEDAISGFSRKPKRNHTSWLIFNVDSLAMFANSFNTISLMTAGVAHPQLEDNSEFQIPWRFECSVFLEDAISSVLNIQGKKALIAVRTTEKESSLIG